MRNTVTALAITGLALAGTASAGIVVTTDDGVWGLRNAIAGLTPVSADLSSIATGFYASGSSWSSGGVNWSASAPGGLFVNGGKFSTNDPAPLTLSFAGGVKSVSAYFSATDFDFNALAGQLFEVTLDNGTTFTGLTQSLANPAKAFVGFVATGSTLITGFTISVESIGGPEAYPTIETMYFAVPAPGAFALLGAAALLGVSGRRR
jgi:hypothetical protein